MTCIAAIGNFLYRILRRQPDYAIYGIIPLELFTIICYHLIIK